MDDFKVVDKTGIWLKSRATFPMCQPGGHRFIPGQPTKVDLDEWIKGQVEAQVLAVCDDPLGPPAETTERTAVKLNAGPPGAKTK